MQSYTLGSLWIRGDLDLSCVLKQTALISVVYNLLFRSYLSLSDGEKTGILLILFVHAKDLRAFCLSPGSLWILADLDLRSVLKQTTLISVVYNHTNFCCIIFFLSDPKHLRGFLRKP